MDDSYIRDFLRKDEAQRKENEAAATLTRADISVDPNTARSALLPDDVLQPWIVSARLLGLNEKRREVRPDWMDRHLRSIRDSATRELLGLHQRRIRVLEKQCAIGVAGILVHDALEQAEKFKWPLSAASAGPQTREQHEDALLVEFRGGGGRVDRDRNGTPRFKGIAKLVDARAGKVGSNESTIRKDLKAAYARERKALSEGSAAEPLFAEAPFGWPARQGRR